MWSSKYYYLNIYKDEKLSVAFSTIELLFFLNSLTELKQAGKFKFINNDILPFIEIYLLNASSVNSWSEFDTDSEKTNLITVICTKQGEENFNKIKKVLIKIAWFVNWDLVDEETDDGVENFIIWTP